MSLILINTEEEKGVLIQIRTLTDTEAKVMAWDKNGPHYIYLNIDGIMYEHLRPDLADHSNDKTEAEILFRAYCKYLEHKGENPDVGIK